MIRTLIKLKTELIRGKNRNFLWMFLHEFSYAEFSSAIEMLQAAKLNYDIKISKNLIDHALDEYNHTKLMRSIISKYTEDNPDIFRNVRFCPNHTIKKGYVDPSKFLFQKYGIERFFIFVGINEQNASKIFTKLRNRCTDTLRKIDSKSGDQQSYAYNVTLASDVIGKIIRDEENHENFSLIYASRNVKKWKFLFFLLWERILNNIRHFCASNSTVNKWVAASIYLIVITLIIPFRFAFSIEPPRMNNLVSKENSDLML
jgi:hypothetical protein